MKKRVFMWFVFFVLLISENLSAQERMIHGIVTTFDSIPLAGVTIKAQNTKQEVKTDSLGNFSIICGNKDKLKFIAHGFYNQKVNISGKIRIVAVNLKLKPGEKSREYAIGYGYVSDANKLNALISLTNDDVNFSQYNNIFELIKARCAGVQILDNRKIIIRGANSIQTSNEAFVLVDGIPYSMDALNSVQPSQIKSINVIKDASSAIYGTRGANGVILIETKRGGK